MQRNVDMNALIRRARMLIDTRGNMQRTQGDIIASLCDEFGLWNARRESPVWMSRIVEGEIMDAFNGTREDINDMGN